MEHWLDYRGDLVVAGPWTDDLRAAIAGGSIEGLVLNYVKGFSEPSLDFLAGLPLKRLDLLDREIRDLSPIESLGGTLEELNLVANPKATLDLASLPLLTSLGADWRSVRGSFHHARNLRQVGVGNFAPDDLSPFSGLLDLESLVLTDRPRIRSFDGLERLQRVAFLAVRGGSYLSETSALDGNRVLDELDLPGCRKIQDLRDIGSVRNLRVLNLNDCGNIESLGPLRGLEKLEQLWAAGDTKILDRDLSPLLQLPSLAELRMRSRREYTPTLEGLRSQLGLRGA